MIQKSASRKLMGICPDIVGISETIRLLLFAK